MINDASPLFGLKEFRHLTNNNLLCKAVWKWHIEIYDKKSRSTVYTWPTRTHNDIWLKGVDFQKYSRDLRCPGCDRLLCRAIGVSLGVQIKCTHCKEVHEFRLKGLYERSFATLPLIAQKKLYNEIKNLTF